MTGIEEVNELRVCNLDFTCPTSLAASTWATVDHADLSERCEVQGEISKINCSYFEGPDILRTML